MAHVEDEEIPVKLGPQDRIPLGSDDSDLNLQTFYLQCLAAGSYVVGHAGQAVVIDPLRDVDHYLQTLDEQNLQLKAVLLTHVHADFVSGHRELAQRGGGVVVSGAKENMSHGLGVMNGDVIALSSKYRIRVLETPGHTPGSIVYVLSRADGDGWKDAVAFTGDTLFCGSCGRPDLVASAGFSKEQMAGFMFSSLAQLSGLPDDCFVLPAHGAGSPCGKSLSDKLYSTIGEEKQTNPAFQFKELSPFVEWLVSSTGGLGIPQYFLNCVNNNKAGPGDLQGEVSAVPRLAPADFAVAHKSLAGAALVLDVRETPAFYRSHVAGSINMPLGIHGGEVLSVVEGNFAIWVGTLIPVDAPLFIIAPAGRRQEALVRLGRVGYATHVRGLLEGDVDDLQGSVELVSAERCVLQSADQIGGRICLDVRTPSEYRCTKKGRVQNAVNLPLGGTTAEYASASLTALETLSLSKDAQYLAYCSGGFRSAIASSILRSAGLNVTDIYGGYQMTIVPKFRELTTLAA